MKRLVIIPSKDGNEYDLYMLSPCKPDNDIIKEVADTLASVQERLGEDINGETGDEVISELVKLGYEHFLPITAIPYYD